MGSFEVELREMAPGVHVFLQPPLIWYSSAGVIVGEEHVVVVDSLSNAAMTGRLLEEIRRVTDRPVRFVINTHSHADHVYTNHMFVGATVISSARGREATREFQGVQARHDALFARLFPEVDLAGGRYTLQDVGFHGSLSLYQGEREIRVLELGPGHSESDVVVFLPRERIVFCGDLFMHEMAPLPGEGRVTRTIANYRAVEALEADVFVAGHGAPGTREDVRAQRLALEEGFQRARDFFEQGLDYDAALQAPIRDAMPLGAWRMILFASYCELLGTAPETRDPESQNHIVILRGVATEARMLLDARTRVAVGVGGALGSGGGAGHAGGGA